MDENEEQDQLCLNFLSQKTNAVSGTLEPELANIVLLNGTPDKFIIRSLTLNADYKTVYDHIHGLLPLNNLQQLVVVEIMYHIIKNKERMCLDIEQQLFLYV